MVGESIFPVGREELHKLAPLFFRETGADPDVLERARVVIKTQQQGAYRSTRALLIPAETGDGAAGRAETPGLRLPRRAGRRRPRKPESAVPVTSHAKPRDGCGAEGRRS